MRVLLIEDDTRLGENIRLNLELRSMQVSLASTVSSAKRYLHSTSFDVFLIDLDLPDGSGFDICQIVRNKFKDSIIFILTAKLGEQAALKGLQLGADDYLRKPIGMKELAFRIEKACSEDERILAKSRYGKLVVDHDLRKVFYAGQDLSLGNKEFEIFKVFLSYPERIFSRRQILDNIELDMSLGERTVDSHISHLRAKLSAVNSSEFVIESVYAQGYRLKMRPKVDE